jgi:aryl-alcohol dehydrogenase-like predicted oxidoreductase
MRYRILGSTGLRVSAIGLGTWQAGGELLAESRRLHRYPWLHETITSRGQRRRG